MKEVRWHEHALRTIREFPERVRKDLGKAIFDLQCGASVGMPLSRPMPSVGAGVAELRVRDASGAYRVFYCTKTAKNIFVFHAFAKKSQATPKREIELAKRRLKEAVADEA